MADRVARSPARLCSTDGSLCYYRRLGHNFLAIRLLFFVSFLPLHPYSGRFLMSLLFVLLHPCRHSYACFSSARTCPSGSLFPAALALLVFSHTSGFLLVFIRRYHLVFSWLAYWLTLAFHLLYLALIAIILLFSASQSSL